MYAPKSSPRSVDASSSVGPPSATRTHGWPHGWPHGCSITCVCTASSKVARTAARTAARTVGACGAEHAAWGAQLAEWWTKRFIERPWLALE
eukprot:5648107-Prymnesium_polylepis.1